MPEINKQQNNAQTDRIPVSILDRITPVNKITRKGINCSFYGNPKTGKTTLLSTFPKPMLIIGTEDGTESIADIEGIDFALVQDMQEPEKLVKYARQKAYKTIGLDTATILQDIALKDILGLDEIPLQKEWGIARIQDYGQRSAIMKKILLTIFNYPGNSVILSHEGESNTPEDAELIVPRVGPLLGDAVAKWLNGKASYIGQTFVRQKMKEVEYTEGEKQLVAIKDEYEYCLRIGPHPNYVTGFRLKRGAKLPNVIVNPTFDKIMYIRDGHYGQSKKQPQQSNNPQKGTN